MHFALRSVAVELADTVLLCFMGRKMFENFADTVLLCFMGREMFEILLTPCECDLLACAWILEHRKRFLASV